MAAPAHCRILILDFGAQYTQLIARRLRETHVYCEIHPYDVDPAFIRAFAPNGIVLSGGPNSVTEGDTPRAPDLVWTLGAAVRARGHSALVRGIEDRRNAAGHGLLDVWMSHGDKVTALPPGFKQIAS